MEELQDAIEDAQYVNAISSVEDGPRPVLPWEKPTEEQLASWKQSKKKVEGSPAPFEFEWTLSHALGFFLFSAYLKEVCNDYVLINFMEEVARWKNSRGRLRAEKTSFIASNFLLSPKIASNNKDHAPSASGQTHATTSESTGCEGESSTTPEQAELPAAAIDLPLFELPPKTEITEYDLCREPVAFSAEQIKELLSQNSDPTKNCIAVGGEVLQTILNKLEKLRSTPGYGKLPSCSSHDSKGGAENEEGDVKSNSNDRMRMLSIMSRDLPENLFDSAEVIVAEKVREKHWARFKDSEYFTKLLNFLWFQDKKVVEEDFFVMRVLGRGGFGLVTGK